MNFTPQQISDWKRYEMVRKGGRWNMLFPQARQATGLSEASYSFCIAHYSELKEAARISKMQANKKKI